MLDSGLSRTCLRGCTGKRLTEIVLGIESGAALQRCLSGMQGYTQQHKMMVAVFDAKTHSL